MGRYIVRRLLQAIPLLILLSVCIFALIHLMPGGPDKVLGGPRTNAAVRESMRVHFGLDQPIYVQYFLWIGHALTGDFGTSFSNNRPVSELISDRLPATVELFGYALVFALIVAILLGVISAVKRATLTDYTLTTLSYFGLAMPIFLFGLIVQYVFGVVLHLLPVSGMETVGVNFDPFNSFVDHFLHIISPVLVLSITYIAGWSRYMRSSMIEVTGQDYMRTARAKGVPPVAILFRHALRNALIPLVTVVAIDFGAAAGGAVITEGVFAWPGMGLLFISSLSREDYPVLLAALMIGAVFVVAFNLLADILYAVIDPRIRYS